MSRINALSTSAADALARGRVPRGFINDFGIGDNKRITRPVEDVPSGRTIETAFLTVKAHASDADASALFKLEISTVSGAAGVITPAAHGVAWVAFDLTTSQTSSAGIIAGAQYDIEVLDDLGHVYTVDRGRIQPCIPIVRIDAPHALAALWIARDISRELPTGQARSIDWELLDDFFARDDYSIRRPVQLPAGRTLSSLAFYAFTSPTDLPGSALVTAAATVDDNGSTTGFAQVTIPLSEGQTNQLRSPRSWRAVATLDNGKKYTVRVGTIWAQDDVTDASTAAVDSVVWDPSPLSVVEGDTANSTVRVYSAGGGELVGRSITGVVSPDPSHATVSPSSGVSPLTVTATGVLYEAPHITVPAVCEGKTGNLDLALAVPDDIAQLAIDLGGRTVDVQTKGVHAIWSTRRGVRVPYSATDKAIAWDDAQCDFAARGSGRYYSPAYDLNDTLSLGAYNAADASQHVTLAVWGQAMSLGGDNPYMGTVLSQWSSSGFILELNSSYDVKLYIGGSGTTYASFSGTGFITPGQPFKLFWMYDGTGAGNADKVQCWLSVWDDGADAWGALTQMTLSFGGTIGANWPSAGSRNLRIGYRDDGGGDLLWGLVDDVRIWPTTTLTNTQAGAEKVRSEHTGTNVNAVAADIWLTFDEAVGSATIVNHGASGSANDAPMNVASHATLMSDHIEGGRSPLLSVYAHAPAWDGTAKTLDFSSTNAWMQTCYQHRFLMQTGTGPDLTPTNHPFGIFAIGSVPDNNGIIVSARGVFRFGLAEVSGQGLTAYMGDAYASSPAGVSPSATRYPLIVGYDGASTANPNNTKQQVHAHAIVKTADQPSESAAKAYFILNSYVHPGQGAGNFGNGGVFTAYGFLRGQPSDADFAVVGNWAVTNEGASAAA